LTESQPTTGLERQPYRGSPTGYDAVFARVRPKDRTQDQKRLDAWGRFLIPLPWVWWWTLTLKPFYKRSEVEVFHPAEVDFQGEFWPESTGVKELKPPLLCPAGVKRARIGLKRFTKQVRRLLPYPHKLESFVVSQRQPHSRSLHLHGLSYGEGLEDVNRKALEEWCWRHIGKAEIRLYDPCKGARFYAAKHLFHQDADAFDIVISREVSRLAGSGEGSQTQPPLVQAAQMDIRQRIYIDLLRLLAPRGILGCLMSLHNVSEGQQ